MVNTLQIGNKEIGYGLEPYVVAEAGINHNGELQKAIALIHTAKEAGCDAVKFQTFKASEFVNSRDQLFTYQSQGKEFTESMLEMFERYELSLSDWKAIREECTKTGITFLSTPQNKSDLDLLLSLGISALKVGSDDFTSLPLLEHYSSTGLPLILSCGMSDLSEVYKALETVGSFDGYPTILLVCTSQYPTPATDANLLRIRTLRNAFPELLIGFSDHTQGPIASSVAVALGAVFLEKHITLGHNLPGPDHWFSENPSGLRDWVSSIHTAYHTLGSPVVRPTKQERIHKQEYQRRLVAAREIRENEILTSECIELRRVIGGKGFPPEMLGYLIGKPAPKSYRRGTPIEL